MISGVGSQATWTNVVNSLRPALAFRSGRTSSSISPGATGSRWARSTAGCRRRGTPPAWRPGCTGGVGGAGQRADGGQVVGAAQLGRRHPSDQACRYVVAGQRLCRHGGPHDGGSAERAQPGQPGQLGRRRAGQPGVARRQLDGRPGPRSPLPARSKGPIPLDKVIAQLQEQPDQVQHWNVDEAGLDDLVAKLSTKPGIHAVHLTDGNATASVARAATETG